jgi:hypothetical protein
MSLIETPMQSDYEARAPEYDGVYHEEELPWANLKLPL